MTDLRSIEAALGRRLTAVEAKHASTRLYGVGRWELLASPRRVAVVGKRDPSIAGLSRSLQLATALAQLGITTVSSIDAGIDAAVHERVMSLGGATIAVCATSLDIVQTSVLGQRVASDGLLVSSFPEGTKPNSANAPRRNRTMALLAQASVIVEAADDGSRRGSIVLHHAWEALRLGRPVFVLADVVSDRTIRWPMELIANGAKVLQPGELGPLTWALASPDLAWTA